MAFRVRAADLLCRDPRRLCVLLVLAAAQFPDYSAASIVFGASPSAEASARGGSDWTGGWDGDEAWRSGVTRTARAESVCKIDCRCSLDHDGQLAGSRCS